MKQNILTSAKKRKVETLLRENQLAEAKNLCEQIFRGNRLDPETLVLLSTAYRRLGNIADAESCCRQALRVNPRFAEAHQALGAALQCGGKTQEALTCYQEAIRLKPELVEAHYLLGNLLRENGLLTQAADYYRAALLLEPEHVPALCNLGGTLAALHQFDEARALLNKANQFRPGSTPILCNMARMSQLLGKSGDAETLCREALHFDAQALDAMGLLAELLDKRNRQDEVRDLVSRGLDLAPKHIGLRICAVRLARREGRHDEAITIAEATLADNPNADNKCELHCLLGQLYDRQDNTERAFAQFAVANRITASKCAGAAVDRFAYQRYIEQRREQFRAAPPPANAAQDKTDSRTGNPVFLVGFPRSGTTLLEQILDSHPQLQALDERPTVDTMQKTYERLVAKRREAASVLTTDECDELRKVYFNQAGNYLDRDPKKLLIDKMPLNLVEAHFISRVFPGAKFILAIRHPCDVCLSCFMQNFALNQAMLTFTSLEDTAATYTGVMSLWQEFTRSLPIQYHRIRYEDLVENMEVEIRRLLEFLEIDWSDAVLGHVEHAKCRGTIGTPSYHQVTQPIYKSAKYRWKRYARELEPIMGNLRPYIEYFGYADADST